MDIEKTTESIYRVTWSKGELRFNLVPMNSHAAGGNAVRVGYASMRPEGILSNSIADLVGIVGLQLNGCPDPPRICWDNREHHFWDGFEGAFEPRNVVVNSPKAELADDNRLLRVGFYYIANLVKTSVEWKIRESSDAESLPM